MTIERFLIEDRRQWMALRKRDVTASVAAALFGVHPYMTAFQLWKEKSGLAPDTEETPAMRRGRLLEPVAIEMLREERPNWIIEKGSEYCRDVGSRIGATPDVTAYDENNRLGVVQIKTVGHWAFKKGWIDPDTGEVEAPLWIAVQASVEAACEENIEWAAVAAMSLGDGGIEMHIEEVPIKPALMTKLRMLVQDFWRRVEQNDPYPPDWKRDASAVLGLYEDKNGETIDIPDDDNLSALLRDRKSYQEAEKAGLAAAKMRKIVDAQIVNRLGNASAARIGATKIMVDVVKNPGYVVEPFQYQRVRVK